MSIEPFIKCSDLQASLAFYCEVLDFEVVIAPAADPDDFMANYAFLERAGSNVHLSAHGSDGAFGSLLYVRVQDIDALFTRFVERGLRTDVAAGLPGASILPVVQTWGMKEFSVLDPDGNKLTFGHELE